MRYIILRSALALLSSSLFSTAIAQTPEPLPNNYPNDIPLNIERKWVPHYPVTDPKQVINTARTPKEVTQITKYLDGSGRPLQVVARGTSPAGKDYVMPVLYDENGKETIKYLPYIAGTSNGEFKLNAFSEQDTYMQAHFPGEDFYYSKTIFEASPLNRVLKKAEVGKNWVGSNREQQTQHQFNTANDAVRIWNMSGGIPVTTTTYPANELVRIVNIDENNRQSVTFLNTSGQLIMKMDALENAGTDHVNWKCTYYVYDDFGHTVFIIPPKATEYLRTHSWNLNDNDLINELCYQFQYDENGRTISKSVPGAGAVEFVYDIRDRLVFSRDANLRTASQPKWNMVMYDDEDRPVLNGFYLSNASRADLQTQMDGATSGTSITYSTPGPVDLVVASRTLVPPGYQASASITFTNGFESNNGDEFVAEIVPGLTTGNITVQGTNTLPGINQSLVYPLTYFFYDAYDANAPAFKSADLSKLDAGSNSYVETATTYSTKLRGVLTGKRERVIGTEQWLDYAIYYDDKGRQLQVIGDNIQGGQIVSTTQYSFGNEILSQYEYVTNPQAGIIPTTQVLTKFEYGADNRLKYIRKRLNSETTDKLIATLEYDDAGQLKKKTYGSNLESLEYDFNIRGWMTGINRKYLTDQESHFFGLEMAYDKSTSAVNDATYTNPRFTGQAAGTMWKSATDGTKRKYDYTYDNLGQFLKADFTQKDGSWGNTVMDFSVTMGDGVNSTSAYDRNGNILKMTQKGMRGTTIATIDELIYQYSDKGNKLNLVRDDQNDENSVLGDFRESGANHTANLSNTNDYLYDGNGNLTKDDNKSIQSIRYNHLNLPEEITVTGKGTITYLYSAGGAKLRETVVDNTANPAITKITDYVGSNIYINDSLKSISHGDGRIRTVYQSATPVQYTYDYFLADQMGNTRMVLTEQTDFSMYMATMEQRNAPVENALFSNIDNSRSAKPSGYPQAQDNQSVAKLNGSSPERRIGPGIVLKVTAGDTVQIGVNAFYKSIGNKKTSSAVPVQDMANALLNAFGNTLKADPGKAASLAGGNSSMATAIGNSYQRLRQHENDPANSRKLRSYLNYAVFNKQFKLVEENSGAKQVQDNPDQLQMLANGKMVVKESGFLYVYTSNESPQDVYFDNLAVILNPGPVLEEYHYYPFGETIYAISGKAFTHGSYAENRDRYNGGAEFNESLNLDWYETAYRSYDPQIGRFHQIDPLAASYAQSSPYVYALNDPINMNDPLGLEATPPAFGSVKELLNYMWDNTSDHGMSIWGEGIMAYADKTPFLAGGLWHDANYYYFTWGFYYGYEDEDKKISKLDDDGLAGKWWRVQLPVLKVKEVAEHIETEKAWDKTQLAMDAGGQIPGYGEILDIANAAISFYRGDYLGGALNLMSAVPIIGNVVSGAKTAAKAAKVADEAVDIAKAAHAVEAAKSGEGLWTATKNLTPVENALGHFKKHGAEFPEFYNAKQYVEGAQNFLHNSPAGTLMKTRTNGDILKYFPETNTFGVMNASGTPRTMFRPTDGMQYWLKQ